MMVWRRRYHDSQIKKGECHRRRDQVSMTMTVCRRMPNSVCVTTTQLQLWHDNAGIIAIERWRHDYDEMTKKEFIIEIRWISSDSERPRSTLHHNNVSLEVVLQRTSPLNALAMNERAHFKVCALAPNNAWRQWPIAIVIPRLRPWNNWKIFTSVFSNRLKSDD